MKILIIISNKLPIHSNKNFLSIDTKNMHVKQLYMPQNQEFKK